MIDSIIFLIISFSILFIFYEITLNNYYQEDKKHGYKNKNS